MLRWRLGFLVLALSCAGMIGFALYEQYYNFLMPCLMCIYQRMAVISYGFVALLAVLWAPKTRGGVYVIGALASIASLGGAFAAAKHVMLQYGPKDPTVSCAPSLPFPIDFNDPKWPAWFSGLFRPVGDCSNIDLTVFGLSMPVWVVVACLGLFGAAMLLCRLRARELQRGWWR
ncbi:disulfide bond formation protein DsbB [Andreprevotia lacus DSM 23236]|jgi:disulfide bond formation protein DsbB|uniref:Disulfide bond formation protein B n=1 Tax=Andreprevotia lacus DSM 23236 TaxID=1121001 RepID=A0A1W1XM82_9NEIS|nr:disulfide bond formation protein B [Andreprevotia lacus]SMC25063.1 disulfide bond formation protein DsbB [Andreprevotia lacus DSM 23236]